MDQELICQVSGIRLWFLREKSPTTIAPQSGNVVSLHVLLPRTADSAARFITPRGVPCRTGKVTRRKIKNSGGSNLGGAQGERFNSTGLRALADHRAVVRRRALGVLPSNSKTTNGDLSACVVGQRCLIQTIHYLHKPPRTNIPAKLPVWNMCYV
jgi:hypothetical protein